MALPLSGLPSRVRIHEVGPRDGLQNEKSNLPTAVKAEFVHRLAAAGLGTIEATGQALANTLAALQRGVTTVDASAGGLGGCPRVWMAQQLGRPSPSRTVRALSGQKPQEQ
jgi:isopropylmalate/homocitrate/citramalate synthase